MPKKSRAAPSARPDVADSKSARTRARILDAAAHVLSVKGYAGTRLSDVAEYAEIQAPAIYYYFPSREDLIEEVMFSGIADMRKHLVEVLAASSPESSPMDRIMTAVEAHLRHELEISDYTTASIRNSGQLPERLRTRQLKEETEYNAIWSGLFDDAATDGQLRSDLDPRMAQALVLGSLNWTAEWWNPRRSSIELIVKNAQSLVRNGLSPADEPPRARRSTTRRAAARR